MLTLVKKYYHIEIYKNGYKMSGDCHTNSISNILNLLMNEYGYKIIKAVEIKR